VVVVDLLTSLGHNLEVVEEDLLDGELLGLVVVMAVLVLILTQPQRLADLAR